jgi:hypothetical protein
MSITQLRALCPLLLVLVLAPAAVQAEDGTAPFEVRSSAATIQMPPEIQAEVTRLLRASSTFRSQYRRIAETPSLVMGVRIDPLLCEGTFRARTTFRRYASGLLVVVVSVGPGSRRTEWLAHEFEHVIEQLEGRDLVRLARDRSRDVWYSADDVFETGRAVRAGRTVLDEARRGQPGQ